MNDTETKNNSNKPADLAVEDDFMTDSAEEEIDEELLALSAPPPSAQHAVFILVILGFSVLVMVLFWPELKYFVKGFADPTPLGEAADLATKQLASDSFVRVEGVPLVNRTVTFSTGTKWFSGDIYRKMAPLSGTPNLLVQWHTHNPNIKQAKDELTPPSDFAGRLKRRADLSENYDKFWPFYDCLKLHNTSQCKFCIGKKDLDECRPIFTCVDNYPIEVCDQTAFHTREEVQEKIQKLKGDLQSRASADLAEELEMNEKALVAFGNIDVLSDFVLVEELFDRVGQLNLPEKEGADALALRKKLFDYQVRALEIRLSKPLEKINGLSSALRAKLEQANQLLETTEKEISELDTAKSKLGPLVDINTELAEFVEMAKEQQEKLRRFDDDSAALKEWTLTGKESGAELLAKVRDLSALIATLKLKPKAKAKPAAEANMAAEDVETGEAATDTDAVPKEAAEPVASTEKTDDVESAAAGDNKNAAGETAPATTDTATEAEAPTPLEDPVLAGVDTQLSAAIERVAELGRKLIVVAPGDVPELDAWAKNTDIVGSLPKPLRADHVFKSFEKLLQMMSGFEAHETASLKTRYKGLLAAVKEKRKRVKELKTTSGLAELSLVTAFQSLKKQQAAVMDEKSLGEAVRAWRILAGTYAGEEFFPWDLSNYPDEKAALAQLVKEMQLSDLETKVSALEAQYAAPMYVLLDDEKPTDNPWILFVYLAVPIMIFINFRKLLRFISEWRQ